MQKDEKTLQINGFVGFYRFLSLNILAILRRGRDSDVYIQAMSSTI